MREIFTAFFKTLFTTSLFFDTARSLPPDVTNYGKVSVKGLPAAIYLIELVEHRGATTFGG